MLMILTVIDESLHLSCFV